MLHEEVSADYTDMIYAETAKDVQSRRRAFLRKWRLRCPAVAVSLEEAGDRLFAFLRLPSSQWKSARTTKSFFSIPAPFVNHYIANFLACLGLPALQRARSAC